METLNFVCRDSDPMLHSVFDSILSKATWIEVRIFKHISTHNRRTHTLMCRDQQKTWLAGWRKGHLLEKGHRMRKLPRRNVLLPESRIHVDCDVQYNYED